MTLWSRQRPPSQRPTKTHGWTSLLGREPSRDEAGQGASNERRVFSAAARENRFVDAFLEADDGPEDDRMGMTLDDFLHQAIEGCNRIGEDRGAGRERGPLR
jgi:hypothetical protein